MLNYPNKILIKLSVFITATLLAVGFTILGIQPNVAYAQDPSGISDLILWLDAADPDNDANPGNNPADSSALTTWSDKSGNGNDATVFTGQNAGAYRSSAGKLINGSPVISFTRISQASGSVYTAPVDIRPATLEDVTIFTVYRPKSIPAGGSVSTGLWGSDNGSWDRFFLPYHSSFGDGVDDGLAALGPVGQGQVVTDAGKVDEVRLMTAVYNGNVVGGVNSGPTNGSAIYFDGQLITTFTDSTDDLAAQTTLSVGWDGDDGPFDGDIAEMVVYSRTLTTNELDQINSYLSNKYGKSFGQLKGPGGVTNGIGLWLKANAEVYRDAGTTLATNGDNALQWHDQSGSGNISAEAQIAATSNITYVTNAVNFNPTVQFDGTSSQRLTGTAVTTFDGFSTIFAIAKDDGNVANVDGIFSSVDNPVPTGRGGQGIYFDGSAYVIDGPGAFGGNTANTSSVIGNNYRLVTGHYSNTGTTQGSSIYLDGGLEETQTAAGVTLTEGQEFEIGGRTWQQPTYLGRIFNGKIAEVVYYGADLTAAEQNKVESYLALKYGVTLTGTQGISYTDSGGTTVWNADTNSVYHHDVAGIGIDANSALTQTTSRSINSDAMVTISGTVGSFLVWGNNDGTTALDQSAGSYLTMARVWKVAETGTVGNVTVMVTNTITATKLLVDNDTDFSNATAYTLTDDGNGNLTADVNFTDGQYFIFAQDAPSTTGPGGVSTNLALWLKANEGVSGTTTVTQWDDQSGNNATVLAPPAREPSFTVAGEPFNFNPVVTFNATNSDVMSTTTVLPEDSNGAVFAVAAPTAIGGWRTIVGFDGPELDGDEPFLGLHTAGFPSLFSDSSTPSSTQYSQKVSVGHSNLLGWVWEHGPNAATSIRMNGGSETSNVMDINVDNAPGYRTLIGGDIGSEFFNGDIAETIVYTSIPTAVEIQRVESYLAIKYGITLITGTTGISYTASDDTTVWDAGANAAYHNDVAGIGIDAGSALTQTTSRSVNTDSVVIITGTSVVSGNFLLWGNDNAGVTTSTTELPGSYTHRLAREWKVKETGDVGNVSVSFDLSNFSGPDFSNAGGFALLIDNDGNFSDATATTGATVNGNVVTFNGISLTDGQYFTLAYPVVLGPITCYATINATTVYSSADSQAVRDAVAAASANDTVKVAGYCAGVSGGQLAGITKILTLRGGYTTTNWTTSDFRTYTTTLDAVSAGRVITTSADVTIESFRIINGNVTGVGGGVYLTAGTLTLSNTHVMSNTSTGNGGGIYPAGGSNIVIENSTLAYNQTTGSSGGGIDIWSTSATIRNSTIYSNTANASSGGVGIGGGTVDMVNVTISHNRAGTNGGGIGNGATLNITNTIVANSINGGDCFNAGTLANNVNNLIEDGTCNSGAITFTNFITGDPSLGPLQDNGGDTWTMAIPASSPAEGNANSASCPSTDQRGVARIGACDIGAYELGVYYLPIIYKN